VDDQAAKVRGDFMSVYAIAQLWVHDPATYERYVKRFMEVFKNYKGRVLVADDRLFGWGRAARICGNSPICPA
jgi:uncharacterized protein (DUF1330 family)